MGRHAGCAAGAECPFSWTHRSHGFAAASAPTLPQCAGRRARIVVVADLKPVAFRLRFGWWAERPVPSVDSVDLPMAQ
jgi:hypothetical protein